MKHTMKLFAIALGATACLTACQGSGEKNDAATDTVTVAPRPSLTLEPVGASPDFPDATLAIKSVKAEKKGDDSTTLTFEFDIKNYQLAQQTSDKESKMCNNSDKGQHIHFILDNKPYTALYEPKHVITLPNNTEHYLMAFLSRSYHESLKNKGAALVYHFQVTDKGTQKKLFDPTSPMIFYSRPKGDYLGKDTANVLLDYYIWNTTIAADGNRVQAHVVNPDQAIDTTFTLTDWSSYFLKNLGTGKASITLTLTDKTGNAIKGENTAVTRNFQLAAAEPMK